MTRLGQAFDSDEHEDMSDFSPVPANEYTAQVKDSDYCDTKNKDGKYIKLAFEILEGEFKGRQIWTNLNMANNNPQTVEIAKKEFATLCRAVGKAKVQDTVELHGIPFILRVGIKPAKGDYPAGNKTMGYKALKGGGPKKNPAAKTANDKPVKTGGGGDGWA
jgi:hypothetical protein